MHSNFFHPTKMPNFPDTSLIRDNMLKTDLTNRLSDMGIPASGSKKGLQVKLTLAELGIAQVTEETLKILVSYFELLKPALQSKCKDYQVVVKGTIPELRRALLWELYARGVLGPMKPQVSHHLVFAEP